MNTVDAARRATVTAMMALLLCTVSGAALAQEHGGALPNTGNAMTIVEGDAGNPLGLKAGYGFVLVREEIFFANTDPNLTTDYGIVYIPPTFAMVSTYPRVTGFTWHYEVANYTVRLYNATRGYVCNFTGITGDTFQLLPGDLDPEGPTASDPMVNATYWWFALVVDTRGAEIINVTGGVVTTNASEPTVFDLGALDLPPLGFNEHVADISELVQLTIRLDLQQHPLLNDGFYKMFITGMPYQFGMSLILEVRYRAERGDPGIDWDKLIFTTRPVDIDVYLTEEMEVRVFEGAEGAGPQLSPETASTGPGSPTVFHVDKSFHVVIEEEGTGEVDWAMYGRYSALAGLILVLLFIILWSGPRKKEGDEVPEDAEEEDAGEAGEEAEEPDAPSLQRAKGGGKRKGKAVSKREQLEARKEALLGEIKGTDERHEAGKLTDREWKATRAALKDEAVEIMKELDALEEE